MVKTETELFLFIGAHFLFFKIFFKCFSWASVSKIYNLEIATVTLTFSTHQEHLWLVVVGSLWTSVEA